jgi:hypothetical protein
MLGPHDTAVDVMPSESDGEGRPLGTLFRESVDSAETQRLIQRAMKHALQTRDAELELRAMLGSTVGAA